MYFWTLKQILLYEIPLLLLWTSLSVQAEFFSLQISVKLLPRNLTQVDWRSYSRELDKSCSVNLAISQDLNIQLHYYISVLNLPGSTFKKNKCSGILPAIWMHFPWWLSAISSRWHKCRRNLYSSFLIGVLLSLVHFKDCNSNLVQIVKRLSLLYAYIFQIFILITCVYV